MLLDKKPYFGMAPRVSAFNEARITEKFKIDGLSGKFDIFFTSSAKPNSQ